MVIGMFGHRRNLRSDKLTAFYVIFVLTSGLKSNDAWRPSQHSHRSQKSNYYHQLIENLEKFEKAKFDDGPDDEGQLGTSWRHDGPVNDGGLGASWRHNDGAEMMNKRSSNKTSGHREESGNEKKEHLRYSVALDSRGDILLFWDIDTSREIIHFRLRAKVDKSDLFAFGFSDYGEATKADFVVMWTDYNGIHMFQDTHTDSRGLLHVDPIQNYDLDRVYVTEDDFIVTEFHRVYDTCDNDDYLIDSGTTHMIYFVKKGPQQSITRWNVSAEKIGMQRVQLIKSQLPVVPLPADTETLTMHVDNVPIPEDETTYWCAVRKLPDFKEKRHIVRFEGAISEQGKGIVHHLEVFHCQIPSEVTINHYDAPCSSKSERPPGLQTCTKVLGAWAMGAQSVSYPEEAGSPIGGKNFSRYVMLEVHYNNPDHAKGLIDSSGIKFYLTKKLRKYDAGIMEIGLEYTDKMALPPGLPIWKLNGYCIPECTQIGDALVTTCVDQTADRKEITLGGFSISDEMCVNYVHYYPLAELEVCKSSVTTDSLMRFFKFLHDYQGEDTMRTEAISENYKSINWTPINVNLLKTYYEMSPLSMQCNQSDGNRFPGHWENTHIPVIEAPMPPTVRPCLQ